MGARAGRGRVATPACRAGMPETRPIPSTGGLYLAGADGSVWRAPGFDPTGRWLPTRRIAERRLGSVAREARNGPYLAVNVCVLGDKTRRPVHRLVAEAWLPDYHPMLEVHHVNGDPTDNRPCNLRCLTGPEHARLHGRFVLDAELADARAEWEAHRDDPPPHVEVAAARLARKRASDRRHRGEAALGMRRSDVGDGESDGR